MTRSAPTRTLRRVPEGARVATPHPRAAPSPALDGAGRPGRAAAFPSIVLLCLVSLPGRGAGQTQLPPAPELDARQAAAEAAPLFADEAPLTLELFVDLSWLEDERPTEEEVVGLLRLEGADGRVADHPVQVRTRGIFRNESRNCSMPPLRLDVPTGQMEGTVFEGQDKLKLVLPCRIGRDDYQTLVLREYLAYRMLGVLTAVSYRVRLVDLTIRDTAGDMEPVEAHGFLIEDEEQMAARVRAAVSDFETFFPQGMEPEQASVVSLFQFMIGNTDWSPVADHNATLLWDDQARYLTVPYDFDFSGIVEAPYASPDPELPIRSVRERLYRGFCWERVDLEAVRTRFLEARPRLEELWSEQALLDDGARQRGLDYLETFYRVLESPGTWRREVLEACRGMPG